MSRAFRRFVVPVDGSQPSRAALAYAASLTRAHGGEMLLCNAVDGAAEAFPIQAFASPILTEPERDEPATVGGQEANPSQRIGDLRVVIATLHGKPAAEIVTYALAQQADAIVIGTHGRSGLSRLVAGSVAADVLRESDVPVFVVPAEYDVSQAPPMRGSTIVVAYDASEPSNYAAMAAIDLAELDGDRLMFVSVLDERRLGRDARDYAKEVSWRLDGFAGVASQRKIPASVAIIQGDPIDEVVRLAIGSEARLVVMGTHGRRGLQRLLLGSVAEQIVCRNPLPTMVVRCGRVAAKVGEKAPKGSTMRPAVAG